MSEHRDVLVIGAGLSGIGAAYRLQTECPGRSYAILEGRESSGGTWDLFRYPGVRSDSDMFTLGYPFRPWRQPTSIATGETILEYLRDTAAAYGIDDHIHYGRRVVSASWSTATARWTVRTATGEEWTCSFLYLCTGYYRYESGYEAEFPGRESFTGEVVHPQRWPAALDYAGRRVVVIGSGATAVTLVPALAERAAHVTMLQRSPSYLLSVPAREDAARRVGPHVVRARNVVLTWGLYQASRRWPGRVSQLLRDGVAKQLPPEVPVDPHFRPRYDPWDQRLCVVPDGDFFAAMRAGRASVVTATIDAFTPDGIRLTDGRQLDADVIVTATGLTMVAFGEIALSVDGRPARSADLHVYKGMMFDGVPNLAWCVGYTNASWTLRADLTSSYVCRLLNYLDRHRIDVATPRLPASAHDTGEPLMNLSSGYVRRAAAVLPRQSDRRRWRMLNNYLLDLPRMRLSRIDDGDMMFARTRLGE
ncbi:flavin-containing monooxygenase [Actinoplanes nipponensis]|uniref:Monooxygenase flavin-binding family protein n=1 Tax=Actinoplanes nipponensis TaxID=135950 RepID=A0A919JSA5_9ACTN|nr:NAD(P)/FAD-dependent oxidoreductase [Actinoplanes nipponensis]GIE54465.1 monooxygenase flavin-binding family protein [Actinoplanes nipponensis]